jgi:hypothetical protein
MPGSGSFMQSYLFAFVAWMALTLGCLGLTILVHLVKGRWGTPIVRIAEAGARVMPVMGLLFIPLAILVKDVYPWAAPNAHSHIFDNRAQYMNQAMFALRGIVFFAFWSVVAYALSGWSRKQDESGDSTLEQRRVNLAAPAAVFFVISITLAITDWVMSLEEHWFSTIFGFYFTISSVFTALAVSIWLLSGWSGKAPFAGRLSPKNWHDLGNLLFTLVVFWAYIAFSQFLITYAGNLPEEVTYYLDRGEGPWRIFGTAVVFLHFLLPFFILLSAKVKRSAKFLGSVAGFIIVIRAMEVCWAVIPSFHREGAQLVATDALAFVLMGAIWIGFFRWQLKQASLLPAYYPLGKEVAEHA